MKSKGYEVTDPDSKPQCILLLSFKDNYQVPDSKSYSELSINIALAYRSCYAVLCFVLYVQIIV